MCVSDLWVCYLAEEIDVETKRLSVPRARVHVVADQQHQLQEFGEALALLHLLAGERHVHDVRSDVVHLLLERQLEQNAVETRPEELHRTHLKRSQEKKGVEIL